jgi:trimeric autotransporter adhesin
LRVQGANLQLLSSNGKKYLVGVEDAYTKLYYDNAEKLATTATGIDVTGTVTATELLIDTDVIVTDSTNDRVGINKTSPATTLDVGGNVYFSGVLRGTSDGSASAPSIQPGNDGDTGLFRPTANMIGFSTLGSERMRIDSSGNVGIGTTSPNQMLELSANNDSGVANVLRFNDADTGVSAGQTTGRIEFSENDGGDTTVSAFLEVETVTTAGGGIMTFGTGAAGVTADEKMRIDSSGSVGIGTTSPASVLDVRGARSDLLRLYSTVAGGDAELEFITLNNASSVGKLSKITATQVGADTNGSILAFSTSPTSSNTPAERMRIDSVGTTTIKTDGTTQLVLNRADASIQSGNQVAQLLVTGDDPSAGQSGAAISFIAGDAWATNSYPTNITFSNDLSGTLTERMRIDSSGNVGIGASSPQAKLHLLDTDDVYLQWTDSGNIAGRIGVNGSYMHFGLDGADGETERMRIDSSGNLLVGTTNTANIATHTPNIVTDLQYGINDGSNIASFGLDRISFNSSSYFVLNESATGVRLINGATSWTTQSDENSKENIVELSGVLTAVNAMRCVRYNLKSQTSDDVKIGFIAQDWQSSYPEVVATDTDGTLGMNYTETIPVLLKAIQEQNALIEALTTRITALEG